MPNTKRGFGSAGLILVILIIIAGGAYLWSQKKVEAPTPTDIPSRPNPIDPGEGDGRSTYRNALLGLEIRYPATYTFKNLGESLVIFMNPSSTAVVLFALDATFNDLSSAVLNHFGTTINPDRETFARNNLSPAPELAYLNTDASRKFKANYSSGNFMDSIGGNPNGGESFGYVFQKNGKIYAIYSLAPNLVLTEMVERIKLY